MKTGSLDLLRALVPAAALAFAAHASAQATPTALQKVGFGVFGGFANVSPDYSSQYDRGFVAGAEATTYGRFFDPGIDLRINHSTGPVLSERSYMADVRLGHRITRRLRVYGDGGLGYGVGYAGTSSHGSNYSDNSMVKALGGGLQLRLKGHFSAWGDYQYQFWKFGSEVHGLTPHVVSLGVDYRFPVPR